MNKYLVFAGHSYYPAGGYKDFKQDFETLYGAEDYMLTELTNDYYGYDWCQIVDLETNSIKFFYRNYSCEKFELADE